MGHWGKVGGTMPVDIVIIILLFILLVIVIVIFWWMRQNQCPETPVVLLDATGHDEIEDFCGQTGALYTNLSGRTTTVSVDLNVSRDGNCAVELSTRANPKFLKRGPSRPRRGAAAIQLANGDAISYSCMKDESGKDCRFGIKLTRI
jgi:hypothetical protein